MGRHPAHLSEVTIACLASVDAPALQRDLSLCRSLLPMGDDQVIFLARPLRVPGAAGRRPGALLRESPFGNEREGDERGNRRGCGEMRLSSGVCKALRE